MSWLKVVACVAGYLMEKGRMTGTVVITEGILATVILLCIIAVLCYCRLQVLGREAGGRSGGEPRAGPCRGAGPHQDQASRPGCKAARPCPASAGEGSATASQTPCKGEGCRGLER